MAEGGQMGSLLDCPICLETLTTPVCLPCGHTFCLQCITDHAQTFRVYRKNEESFNCPTCRQTVAIPDGGIVNLPRNYLAEQMTEKSTLTKIACDECREWNQSEAASWRCFGCDLNLCGKCKHVHSGDTSITHTIKRIVTPQSTSCSPKCINKESCHIHPREVLRFFCEPCKVPLCRDCVGDHQGHGRVDIRKAADRARQGITAAMIDKKSQIQNYEAMIAGLTKTRETMKSNTENEIKKTRKHTKLLLDKIKQKSINIEQQIKNTSDASISTLQIHMDKLLKHVADLQSDVDKCNAAMSSTRYTELLNIGVTGLSITENTHYRPPQLNGLFHKPLRHVQFIGKDTDCLNLDKAYQSMENKMYMCLEKIENNFGNHITLCDLLAPPFSRKPHVVTSFHAPQSRLGAVASTSRGQLMFPTDDGRLVFYEIDGTTQTKSLLNKDRSSFKIGRHLPYDFALSDDDSILMVNFKSRDDGGGVYLFNKEGVQTGVIELDWPRAAAYVADGEVAVLTGLPGGMYEIWKVTGNKRRKIKTDINVAQCITVNKPTGSIIVTHRTGVTTYRYLYWGTKVWNIDINFVVFKKVKK